MNVPSLLTKHLDSEASELSHVKAVTLTLVVMSIVSFVGVFDFTVVILSLVLRKPVFGVSDQVQHKPGCAATEDS